jgi:hypothetical protein
MVCDTAAFYCTSTFLIPSGRQLGGITRLPAFALSGIRLPNVTALQISSLQLMYLLSVVCFP